MFGGRASSQSSASYFISNSSSPLALLQFGSDVGKGQYEDIHENTIEPGQQSRVDGVDNANCAMHSPRDVDAEL